MLCLFLLCCSCCYYVLLVFSDLLATVASEATNDMHSMTKANERLKMEVNEKEGLILELEKMRDSEEKHVAVTVAQPGRLLRAGHSPG